MTTGATVYIETPWGLFTQQQLFMLMLLIVMSNDGADITNSTTINTYTTRVRTFYATAWPNAEASNL